MALNRARILKRLSDEGIIGMNRELPFPPFPQRIAVISSRNAAGYSDFMDHLTGNSHSYQFRTTLFDAVMQGKETSASVRKALNNVYENIDDFDLVAIVRGGGSQADLSWFDDYDIAYLVTQFPLPVITGIGHEKDISVCDIVAFSYLKTPTAVADYIIERTAGTEEYLDSIGRAISGRAARIITDSWNRLDYHIKTLKPTRKRFLDKASSRLEEISNSIKPASKKLLSKYSERIINLERSVEHLRPESVLKRGYSITRLEGRIIKDAGELSKGDRVVTVVHKGTFESEVFDFK
jgi:exodeoxyribonuclease VII large subunit